MSDNEADNGGLDTLNSISEGAGLFLIGKGISKGFGLVTNVVLTRYLGTSLYGIYTYLNVIFSLFTVFTKLGGDKSVLRFLPEYEDQPRKRQAMLTLAYGTSIAGSVVVAALVYFGAPLVSAYTLDDPLFVDVLQITAIVIPFQTLSLLTFSVFKAIERMDYNVAVSSVARPAIRLVFIGGAVALGYSLVGAAAGLIVSGVLTLLVALGVLIKKTDLDSIARPTRTDAERYYDFSVPLTFTQLGSFLYNRIDLLMVGFLLSGSAVGVYNVAVLLSGLLSLPLSAFNQLFPPIASRLYHDGEYDELEDVYGTITRLIFTTALFPAVAAFVYAPELLRIFGEGFVRGERVLWLFVVAQLTNALVGPSGYLLMMSDHQYLTLANQLTSGVLNAILNYVLILEFGFIGAALATATVLTLINIVRVAQVWYLEGFSPYDWTYLKPAAAGVVAGGTMYGLSIVLSQYALLVVGGGLGAGVFLTTLYLLGIQDRDIELVRNLVE
ncbi:flippase [Haloplanus natans]|uniref:flippase n=1 Tax=Haloplanus natans TaxID=376171 RepID=UPI000677AE7F|nr:flippase [Haloplanus natans]